MRRVSLLAVLLCALTLFAVPSHAATSEGILVRGSRTSWVDVYVYSTATIAPGDIEFTRRGSFAGFYLSPAPANRPTVGALVMPRVGATGETATDVVKLGESWDVAPGMYRLFLITDGYAEVFVPIEGQGLRGFSPNRPAPLAVHRADFDVPAGSAGEVKQYPLALRARSLVVAAGVASSTSLTAVDQVAACVTSDTGCSSYSLSLRAPAARAWAYGAVLQSPGRFNGILDVRRVAGEAAGADAGSHVDGAILVLTIGVQN
ncbi:MAG TPA: hypothetical protein VGX28_01400 [Frankiaceae bacterium]|jgi:hypothetical protein|nr:hypothetical protein [Frankiaceae bacterium]